MIDASASVFVRCLHCRGIVLRETVDGANGRCICCGFAARFEDYRFNKTLSKQPEQPAPPNDDARG